MILNQFLISGTDTNISLQEDQNFTTENEFLILGTGTNIFLQEEQNFTTENQFLVSGTDTNVRNFTTDENQFLNSGTDTNIFLKEEQHLTTENQFLISGTNTQTCLSYDEQQQLNQSILNGDSREKITDTSNHNVEDQNLSVEDYLIDGVEESEVFCHTVEDQNLSVKDYGHKVEDINLSVEDYLISAVEVYGLNVEDQNLSVEDYGHNVEDQNLSVEDYLISAVEESEVFGHNNVEDPNLSVEESEDHILSPDNNSIDVAVTLQPREETERDENSNYATGEEDDYHWRKYGQKHIRGSASTRSYYKCTHLGCKVTKKVQRSPEGEVLEIIYTGFHNHPKPPPPPNRRSSDLIEVQTYRTTDHRHRNVVTSSVYDAFQDQNRTQLDYNDDEGDESDPRKRMIKEHGIEMNGALSRTLTGPSVIIEVISEKEVLNDGYRWRKYGQKVVKGNPNPRSYYKCTTPKCLVRKHLERSSTNNKAVLTSYEGRHNHERPPARNTSGPSSSQSIIPSHCLKEPSLPLVQNEMARFGLNYMPPQGPPPSHNFTYEMNQHRLDNGSMAVLTSYEGRHNHERPPVMNTSGPSSSQSIIPSHCLQEPSPLSVQNEIAIFGLNYLPPQGPPPSHIFTYETNQHRLDNGPMAPVFSVPYLRPPPPIGNGMNGGGMMMVPNMGLMPASTDLLPNGSSVYHQINNMPYHHINNMSFQLQM